jgi:LmbE family N-acetylglucosaminyl deacetylase
MGLMSTDHLIQGKGTPEPIWEQWQGLASLRTQPFNTWLPAKARLVVIAPHPDDEILACGALLSMHAARGGESLIVSITDGEASHEGTPESRPRRLAAMRRAERAKGLSILGLRDVGVCRFGLPDGRVSHHGEQLVARFRALLKPTDVVVTTWRRDGHPDHDITGIAAARACLAVGCRLNEAPIWMWHWAQPDDARVPWHRLRGLEVRPRELSRKQAALAAHVSQLDPRGDADGPVLDTAILARSARNREYFFV